MWLHDSGKIFCNPVQVHRLLIEGYSIATQDLSYKQNSCNQYFLKYVYMQPKFTFQASAYTKMIEFRLSIND